MRENATYGLRVQVRSCLHDLLVGRRTNVGRPGEHLEEAMRWLCRAQDATPDGGVARQFNLRKGWLPSYPETTGYIIPTFFNYAGLEGQPEYARRAERMAEWLLTERLEDGSTYGGGTETPVRAPAIFNTGMVQFGFLSAFEVTGRNEYADAACKAAEFLLESQDQDGAWRRNLSIHASGKVRSYNTRTAWALARTGRLMNEPRYVEGAIKNIAWALQQSNEHGWLLHNDLETRAASLTHTIAYAFRGILETALLVNREDWIAAVKRPARTLVDRQERNGSLAGRFDDRWNAAERSVCLTGCAQIALIWLRLYEITRESRFLHAAQAANRYVMSTQDRRQSNPGIRGGIKGSHPVWGEYLEFCYPNWAAKFFADAIMLELRVTNPASPVDRRRELSESPAPFENASAPRRGPIGVCVGFDSGALAGEVL